MNQTPIHPVLPLGLGSYITLTGIAGATVSFIVAWAQYGLTAETVALGITAGATIIAWFAGRSAQAKAAITAVAGALGTVGVAVNVPLDDQVVDEPPEEELDFKGPVDEPVA